MAGRPSADPPAVVTPYVDSFGDPVVRKTIIPDVDKVGLYEWLVIPERDSYYDTWAFVYKFANRYDYIMWFFYFFNHMMVSKDYRMRASLFLVLSLLIVQPSQGLNSFRLQGRMAVAILDATEELMTKAVSSRVTLFNDIDEFCAALPTLDPGEIVSRGAELRARFDLLTTQLIEVLENAVDIGELAGKTAAELSPHLSFIGQALDELKAMGYTSVHLKVAPDIAIWLATGLRSDALITDTGILLGDFHREHLKVNLKHRRFLTDLRLDPQFRAAALVQDVAPQLTVTHAPTLRTLVLDPYVQPMGQRAVDPGSGVLVSGWHVPCAGRAVNLVP